ncbi:MAG: glycosyltransferase [Burkholderiales bacterium]|nr:glycosyltransferase [Burkholderiales bacterium]
MTPLPLASVIVRSMDRPTLDVALASIATQSWPHIEVLVVDARGRHRELPAACGAFPLRMVGTGARLDRSAAANFGLQHAQGPWCLFLDDDDWIEPTHIAALAQALQREPEAVAAYSATSCVLPQPQGGFTEVMRYDFPFDAGRLLCENYLPIHSVLFSREAALRTQGFDAALPIFEDWDFWLQLAREGAFVHVDQVSAVYRLGSGDSGLFGNTTLQEEMAARVLAKWLPLWQRDEVGALWRTGRNALRASAERAAQVRQRDGLIERQATLIAGQANELKAANVEIRRAHRVIDESSRAQARLQQALQAAVAEHARAVELLRAEQFTVLRPVLRNVKKALKPAFGRLPAGMQRAVHRMLRRPVQAFAAAQAAPHDPIPAAQWREALAGGDAGKPTVLVFPVIDWHFRVQRPQHLARELAAQGHRVLYFSTTFAPGSGPGDLRIVGSPAPNVHLLQLPLDGAHPNIYEDALSPSQAQSLADCIVWLQREAGLGALVSLVNLPFWRPVADVLPANLMVYDCMDYHAGFSTNTGAMLDEEHALLRDCDLLVTSSLRLSQLMREKAPGKPHALVRNGTEVAHFATVPPALKVERDARPVVGYFGAISEWFDMKMVVAAAKQRPGWRFILVGSTFGCDVAEAGKLPNIEFTGEVPYAELPSWVHGFDVCVIPFVLNELTSCTNPVKVYEYLSAGKPVVATRMPELEAIADQVLLADDADGFVRQVERALQHGRDPEQAQARRDWAAQHSWASRAQQLSEALDALVPTVSVVVLCYNNLALTQACLASVEQHSHWPRLELVVVDNASTDGTADWLREFAATRAWVKLVLNDKNLGFAAGNNSGLAAATGDVLVMLNNDTQVSPGWIHGLWHHLVRDETLGMVGPVTNNIGNEAKVEVGYSDPAGMPAWAATRAVRFSGKQTNCRVLAFFCVALRREVYQKVGGLDEAFGLGFFEDDDYCNRVRAAGWQMAIADDVFVHHHLSASFDQLKASSRQALFEKNRAIYESKWGPWVPHQYRKPEPHE